MGRRLYGIQVRREIVTLTGEIGNGKTLLNHVLHRRDNNGAWVMS